MVNMLVLNSLQMISSLKLLTKSSKGILRQQIPSIRHQIQDRVPDFPYFSPGIRYMKTIEIIRHTREKMVKRNNIEKES